MSFTPQRSHVWRGLLGLALVATVAPLAASPVAAAAVNDPPVLPHSIIVFPVRDFVSAQGYAKTDRPTVEVLRGGVVVGTASNLTPTDDPGTPGFDGLVEVNHPGGGCWEGVTPDIRAGDVVRVSTSPGVGDSTPTADVSVTQPATKVNAGTVVVKGSAVSATGGQIPVDQLEARIVANKQAFVVNGKRTLRASAAGGDGTLSYDSPTSTSWTATFTGLDAVSAVDHISDADRAVSNQSRGFWLGRNPASTAEGTIFEYGEVPGPAAPCTAPLASGPSVPDMTAATDTGASSTDNITKDPTPSFSGVTGLADARSVNLYVDGTVNGTAAVSPGGAYTVAPATPLTDGTHVIKASEVSPAGVETISSGSLSITIDTTAPATAEVTGTVPGSPGISRAPAVKGTAEPGSTVSVFADAACASAPLSTGSAGDFATSGIATAVAADSTTKFFATATDPAGNAAACSASSATYVQDSVAPAVPDIGTASTAGLVNATTASFTFSDTETGATFECSLDGGPLSACSSPKDFIGVKDGTHTFAVRASDAAGNHSLPASTAWTVDTVAPTVAINSPTGAVINDNSPTFRFAASEAGSSVACSMDGTAAAPCTTPDSQASSLLGDGPHVFTVTATDAAGNVGPAASYRFTVDTAKPQVSIDSTPPSPTNDNTPAFTFSSPKAGVTYTCAFALASTASPSFTACPGGSFAVAAARADGDYRFTVRATDPAGNVGSASTLVTIDTAAPAAPSITTQPAATSKVTTPSFGFTSPEPGATFQCTLTPGPAAAPCTTGETYGPLTDGAYSFKVTVKDAAGNVSAASGVPFTVDTAAPAVTVSSGPTGVITTGTASFAFSSSDGGATFECSLSPTAATFTRCVTGKSYTGLANGSYTFQVRATDAAGNVGTSVSRSFTVNTAAADTTAPTVSARKPAINGTAAAVAGNVTATFNEAVKGVSGTTFKLKNATTGTAVAAAVSYAATTRIATLNPTVNLASDTKYTATLSAGITDTAANPLVATTWTFTTGPAPTVVAKTPAAGALGVARSANVTATFSEKVQAVSGTTFTLKTAAGTAVTAVVSYNATTKVATLNPSVTLAANTKYTARLSKGIHDIAGNPLTAVAWTFTTGP